MAAARTRLFSPEALLVRLNHRLKLLTRGAKDLPERQQTLRGAIDWSYDLLDEGERRLFRRLCVFVGGFTVEAAEVVCPAPGDLGIDLVEGLDSLVGKSLVRLRDPGEGSLLTLLETLREYGLERLAESSETDSTRAAHAAYYRSLTEQAVTGFMQGARAIWVPRLDRELSNVRAAMTWALGGGNSENPSMGDRHQNGEPFRRIDFALGIASALFPYWTIRGYQREGRNWIDRGLAQSDPAERTQQRAKAILVAAVLAAQQGDSAAGGNLIEEGVSIARETGDKGLLAEALSMKGMISLHLNDATGHADLDESVRLFGEVGDTYRLALTLFMYGDAVLNTTDITTDIQAARARLAESLALFRRLDNPTMVTLPTVSLGRLAWLEGDYPTARSLIEEALAIRREDGDKWPLAGALSCLADVARCQGEQERAAELAEESLTLFRDFDDASGTAWTLSILGHVARSRGDHARAQALFAESLALRDQQRNPREVAQCLAWLGGVAVAAGQFTRAATLFGAADARLQPLGARWSPADQASYERDRDTARTNLGQGPYFGAWNAGQTMSTKNAIELASRSDLQEVGQR
jgi:tetratricopeptide (TPR) repeat protein